nr:RDD family protein [Galbitalea soli]
MGLPASGPRSVARLGRRVAALAIDWALCSLIGFAFFRPDPHGLATLGVFVVEQIIFLVTLGGSVGHLLVGLRLVPVAGGYLGVWRPIVRTLLLAVVIPAVIWNRDQRGVHDLWAGTVLVRR